jgi:hypothetical protein
MELHYLALVMAILSFESKADIYKCVRANGSVEYTDRQCSDKSKPEYIVPKYIKFKRGSTACHDIKYWKEAIDNIAAQNFPAFKKADRYCKYLRGNTYVLGILQREPYKGTELGKIKASDGITYWIELPAVLPITDSTQERPLFWMTDIRDFQSRI